MIGRVRSYRSDSGGQSVVEFALIAPLMIFIMFAILDFARIYTAMASVESAAREAADFGTALGAERWSPTNIDDTVAKMNKRACIAASDLPDYAGLDTSTPPDGIDDSCSNPTFAYCITQTVGGSCDFPVDTLDPSYTCNDPARNPPCRVTVEMGHVFHMFVPLQLNFFGTQLGFPSTLAFERDSTFAMTDIDVTPPSP